MDIKLDSRKIVKGDTFIAIKGISRDGHDYIEQAISNGASKIIAEHGNYSVETVIVDNTKDFLSKYLKDTYYNELKDIKFIGITGTNGKTTSSYLVYQLFNKLGHKTAYIGTIGFILEDECVSLDNTTPEITDLYEMFLKCKEKNIKTIVMEVSSQAISYGRVTGLEFDLACFTNLTQDHLDYHLTMENYMNCKLELFKMLRGDRLAIINEDDPHHKNFALETNNNIYYGESSSDFKIYDIHLHMNGSEFKIEANFKIENKSKIYDVELLLPGKYNIYNYMNAFISALKFGFDSNLILEKTKELIAPDGRYDLVNYKDSYIIIDFAHSPDAIENILNSINEYKKGKVYTIVGCGGNRDRAKRPIMGKISTDKSDYVIFTNDNPRFEDEKQIMDDIVRDLNKDNFEIIFDRVSAIKKGVSLLKENDVLLILGKGHEPYQIIGDTKHHFSDKDEVVKIIEG